MDTREMPRSTLGHGFRAGILSAVALVSFCCAMPFVSSDVAAEPAPEATSSEQSVERSRPKPSARPKASKPSDPDELAFKAAVDAIYARAKSPLTVGKPAVAKKIDAEESTIKQFVFKKHIAAYRAEVAKDPESRLTAVDLSDLAAGNVKNSKAATSVKAVLRQASSDIYRLVGHVSQESPVAKAQDGSMTGPAPTANPSASPAFPPSFQPLLFGIGKNTIVPQPGQSGL